MKLRRLFCFLLVFVFIFCALFSVSAFAAEVDEQNVFTSFYDSSVGDYVEFENTLVSTTNATSLTLLVDIHLTNEIESGTVFDLNVGLTADTVSSLNLENTIFYDSDWNIIDQNVLTKITNTGFTIDDGQPSGNLKYIRFKLVLNYPSYTVVLPPQPFNFKISGTTYTAIEGMTWTEWVNSEYNTDGFYTYKSGTFTYVYASDGRRVSGPLASHTIEVDGYYPLSSSSSPADFEEEPEVSVMSLNNISGSSISLLSSTDGTEYHFTFYVDSITVTEASSEEIEGGIFAWVKRIFSGIINLPKNIANSIGNFFTELGNKINDLGNFLLDGIKNLFVPSEEDITNVKTKFENLLADRFGAVYDSTQIIDDFANAFKTDSESAMTDSEGADGSISFPSVSVNLAGSDFTFGGWEVDLIPDKFDGLIDVVKMISNISMTLLFVTGMRKRLEELLK